ncbi:MAG: glycosyltransferase [Sphingomonadales bacterium]|jgi:spore maturation protein CgeB
MSVRIIRTSTIPQRYLNDLYQNRIMQADAMGFEELRSAIFSYFIHEFDQYSHYINKGSRYQMTELIVNDNLLQHKWAEEHGLTRSASLHEILEAQIAHYQPDIFFDNSNFFMHHDADAIKKKHGISAVIAWDAYTGSRFEKQSKGVDVVLTCVEFIRKKYESLGFTSVLLPFAFDRRVFESLQNQEDIKNRLCFIGTISDNVHKERKALLLDCIRAGIPFSLYISNIGKGRFCVSRAQVRALKDGRFDDFFDYFRLQAHNLGGVYGSDMFKTLGNHAIQLNIHGDNSLHAGNMRLYEATGMGSLLLTDWKSNIADIFEPEKEIITYKTPGEAIDKARYFLAHPKEAAEIARNGQLKTFTKYAVEDRINRFETLCDELMNNR